MYPIGICTGIANAAIVKTAGAAYVEENVQNFLVPEQPEFRFQRAAVPVRAANYFIPGKLKCVGPAVDLAALVHFAGIVLQRAQQAGIEIIVFGSAGSRQIPDGFSKAKAEEQFLALLRELGPLAARHDITIVVEPISRGECNFINSVPEGAVFVAACNHPNIRLLADFYHMLREGQSPDDIRRHGGPLRHVHVAEKATRTAPGVAGDDFRPFLKALQDVHYKGAISIECNWTDLAGEAGPAVAELNRQIREA
jgi:sugar phosphate isomerase/epimerase